MKEDLVNGIARAMKIVFYTFVVIMLLGNLKIVELESYVVNAITAITILMLVIGSVLYWYAKKAYYRVMEVVT